MTKHFYEAIATLIGTVIGAGIFAIPYVVAKSGFLIGAFYIVFIGLSILMINLYIGEIALRTKENHQLTGYAGKYLGKWGKRIMTFSMIFGIYGALTAYLIGEGNVLSAIFGGPPLIYSLLFFVVVSAIIYVGLKLIKRFEVLLCLIFLFIIFLMIAFSFGKIDLTNLAHINLAYLFLPYGVVLFAFLGAAAIPEMKEELVKHKKMLKKAIIFGSLIPLVVYLIFALVVVGVTGLGTTEIATIGLGNLIGEKMILFGNLFAIFAMATSFLTLGLALKQMYNYDYKLNNKIAWLLTCSVPLIVFLLGVKSFIKTIGIAGAIAGGIDGILIVLIFWRVKKLGERKPEYSLNKNRLIGMILMLVFILGVAYTVWSLIR